ncbi:uncharacterized protein LOC114355980 [Ostrinia furnacalis]|uniref:uncharacterized protein LOC114355980 n=1 Tax=Ostrinia furnacalis TaxID=93504 RepID=UPI00103EB128|nr:uncharacterized protein LOC114355980 [Ostrinia furnacalis]
MKTKQHNDQQLQHKFIFFLNMVQLLYSTDFRVVSLLPLNVYYGLPAGKHFIAIESGFLMYGFWTIAFGTSLSWNFIINETNRYAWESIAPSFETGDGIPRHSRMSKWVDTSVAELYKLFAIIIFMGMCVRGRIDEYWSTKLLGMPGFRRIMTKERFLLLMRFLHFANNAELNVHGPESKLSKIKPIIDFLNKKKNSPYTL